MTFTSIRGHWRHKKTRKKAKKQRKNVKNPKKTKNRGPLGVLSKKGSFFKNPPFSG
jgi:UDP-N-acetylenolpyruvoylglucosamine reductase